MIHWLLVARVRSGQRDVRLLLGARLDVTRYDAEGEIKTTQPEESGQVQRESGMKGFCLRALPANREDLDDSMNYPV